MEEGERQSRQDGVVQGGAKIMKGRNRTRIEETDQEGNDKSGNTSKARG